MELQKAQEARQERKNTDGSATKGATRSHEHQLQLQSRALKKYRKSNALPQLRPLKRVSQSRQMV